MQTKAGLHRLRGDKRKIWSQKWGSPLAPEESVSLRLLAPSSMASRALQGPAGLYRSGGLSLAPGEASQAGLTAARTSGVSQTHPCCDGFCTLKKKSLQAQPGRHKSQRLRAAAADMTYGPIAMATGAQPAWARKCRTRLTGLCGALMERPVFQRKDVFSGTHCPFVFILDPNESRARSISPSPANRLFSALFCLGRGFLLLTCPPKGLQARAQLELACKDLDWSARWASLS